MTAEEIRVEAVRVEHQRGVVRYCLTVKAKLVADHEVIIAALAASLLALDAEIANAEARIMGGA